MLAIVVDLLFAAANACCNSEVVARRSCNEFLLHCSGIIALLRQLTWYIFGISDHIHFQKRIQDQVEFVQKRGSFWGCKYLRIPQNRHLVFALLGIRTNIANTLNSRSNAGWHTHFAHIVSVTAAHRAAVCTSRSGVAPCPASQVQDAAYSSVRH